MIIINWVCKKVKAWDFAIFEIFDVQLTIIKSLTFFFWFGLFHDSNEQTSILKIDLFSVVSTCTYILVNFSYSFNLIYYVKK